MGVVRGSIAAGGRRTAALPPAAVDVSSKRRVESSNATIEGGNQGGSEGIAAAGASAVPRRILAIDPGTRCGYAYATDGHSIRASLSGVWDLSPRRHEGGGMRYVRLLRFIGEVEPELVVYEEVRRHLGTDAAHIYGGIVATITGYCEQRRLPYCGIPVGTVKKFATGKGNADKEAMVAAAQARFGREVDDDNQADALFILSAWIEGQG